MTDNESYLAKRIIRTKNEIYIYMCIKITNICLILFSSEHPRYFVMCFLPEKERERETYKEVDVLGIVVFPHAIS